MHDLLIYALCRAILATLSSPPFSFHADTSNWTGFPDRLFALSMSPALHHLAHEATIVALSKGFLILCFHNPPPYISFNLFQYIPITIPPYHHIFPKDKSLLLLCIECLGFDITAFFRFMCILLASFGFFFFLIFFSWSVLRALSLIGGHWCTFFPVSNKSR